MTQIRMYKVEELTPSRRSLDLHADFDPLGRDAWLVDDVRQNGVIIPIVVKPNKELVDGHRRCFAARHVGIKEIQGFESEDVFESAQLARNMTLYAKCVLYRDKINALILAGDANRKRALDGGSTESVEQQWIQVEEILLTGRRSLLRGAKLLDQIDQLCSGTVEDQDRGRKIANIFRVRGLDPARRLLGESDETEVESPDCKGWETEDGPKVRVRRKAKAVKASPKPVEDDDPDPPTVPFAAPVEADPRIDLIGDIRQLQRNFDREGLSTPATNHAFATLVDAVKHANQRVAA